MDTINVSKEDLLAKLKENLEVHKAEYADAMAKWREEIIDALNARTAAFEDDEKWEKTSLDFSKFPKPQTFEKSYDEAIAMLEWEQEPIIELTDHDFRRYVLNQWEWRNQYLASTANYTKSSLA